ncbi:MAG: synthase family protein, partial [Chitinophagaceae bacterium]|nr:synthase family protein [Chitinophagaceae bacterium]
NRNGQPNQVALNYSNFSRDSLYLEQVAFCNQWIGSLTRAANKSFKRPRIVIIEGDHGYRDADDNQLIRDREFMNLSSYYFSDKDYRLLYKNISPVNSFRVILNKYFNTQLPLLRDSTILLYSNKGLINLE